MLLKFGITHIQKHNHTDLFKKLKIDMETDEFKNKLRERLWKIEGGIRREEL